MILAAIDPGLTGAIAYVDESGLIDVFDLPVVDKRISSALFSEMVRKVKVDGAYFPVKHVCIEDVHAGPKDGRVGAFKFGRTLGNLEACAATLHVPITYVQPATWKRKMGLMRQDKEASRRLAIDRHPDFADLLKLKKHHGRAEAILIADYATEFLQIF